MGVLACDRLGCENIMCDYHSHTYGYLCSSCVLELVNKGSCNIEVFMNTPKGGSVINGVDWEYCVLDEFKDRYN